MWLLWKVIQVSDIAKRRYERIPAVLFGTQKLSEGIRSHLGIQANSTPQRADVNHTHRHKLAAYHLPKHVCRTVSGSAGCCGFV